MAGARITATLDDVQFRVALNRLAAVGRNPTPVLRAIGVGLQHVTIERFETARDPTGKGWKPLTPLYARYKIGPGILREAGMRGGLQGSITFATAGKSVIVGSNKIYAAVHQFGATIVPVRAKYLRFFYGPHLQLRKAVTIPARPYLGFGAADREAVLDVLHTLLPR